MQLAVYCAERKKINARARPVSGGELNYQGVQPMRERERERKKKKKREREKERERKRKRKKKKKRKEREKEKEKKRYVILKKSFCCLINNIYIIIIIYINSVRS